MKNGFMLLMACAITIAVAVSKDNEKGSDPSASLVPARQFGVSSTTAGPSTTTAGPSTTTAHHSTTTAHHSTTTAHHSTTTAHHTPTTAHHSTTTAHQTTTTAHHTTTTAHHSTTTAHHTPTTAHHTTTTAHHTPTTAHHTPTTAHHTTTTAHHTTTTAHHTTTTAHPNTTTAAPPAPPTPTPKAKLTVGDYNLSCAMLSMALQIRVDYDPKTKSEGTYILQSGKATPVGSCENSSVNFNITFTGGFIDFQFEKNDTEKLVYVRSVAVELTYPFDHADPTAKYKAGNSSVRLFPAAIGDSYSCRSQSVYLGNGIHLEMTEGRMQAFNTSNHFGPPNPCPADKPDYRVAIAVGIVLLILIIIVVVAYIIGRRKRTDGYQSL